MSQENYINPNVQDEIRQEIEKIYEAQEASQTAARVEVGLEEETLKVFHILEIGRSIENQRQRLLEKNNSKKKHFGAQAVKQLFGLASISRNNQKITDLDQLKNYESEIGATIFGETLPDQQRAFFNDTPYDWYYQEVRPSGEVTLHYEVRPDDGKILRINSRHDLSNEFIGDEELANVYNAIRAYQSLMDREIFEPAGVPPSNPRARDVKVIRSDVDNQQANKAA